MSTPAEDLTVIAALLSVEHSVVYAYGLVGAQLQATSHAGLAQAAYDAHRIRRDSLAARIRALGGRPPAAHAAYRVEPPHGTGEALRLAAALEDRCAAAYHDAVASTDDHTLRAFSATALSDCAVRATTTRLAAGVPPATAATALPGA